MVSWLFQIVVEIYGYYLNWDRYGWLKHYPRKYIFSDDVLTEELKNFLIRANKTKFWKEKFAEYDINLESEDLIAELKKLPVLSKDEVKSNINELKGQKYLNQITGVQQAKTSGSTGNGMIFQTSRSFRRYQWMVWYRHFDNNDVPVSSFRLWLGGRTIFPSIYSKPYLVIKSTKTIYLNIYKYSPSDEKELMLLMKKYKVGWIHGYPSTVFAFVKEFTNTEFLKDMISSITVSSENLEKSVAKYIEAKLDARVIEHYGQSEGVANISFDGMKWRVDKDFTLVEYERMENDLYKVIGTGYRNEAFPLIRYDTDDLALMRNGEVLKIFGRSDDYVILPSGRRLYRMDHLFKGIEGLHKTQIVQNNVGILEIHYQAISTLKTKDLDLIESRFLKMTSEEVELQFIRAESFIKGKSGKVKTVIRSNDI